jgi:hypothetical protein
MPPNFRQSITFQIQTSTTQHPAALVASDMQAMAEMYTIC